MEISQSEAMDDYALAYIESLAASSTDEETKDSWYCILACAFTACNEGRYVAHIYRTAIKPHASNTEKHKFILRRIKESLLKTGIIYGIPRLINAFRSLITALPSPESNEISSLRNHITTPSLTDSRGLDYMRNIFRADLDPFLTTMDQYWPDLRTLVVTTIYGYYQSEVSIIDAITTSQLNVATLIPMDVPSEVGWHMRGLIRNAGSREQLDFVVEITMKVMEICEVGLRNAMPKTEDVVDEERLF